MTKVEIGYLFKEIRLERGLTITDVAGNMSASTVSKFENGHSEISAEKLILLLNRLGMDATEFFKILSIKQNGLESLNNFSQRSFDKYLMQLALEQDIEGLIHFRKQFTDQYQKTHAKLYKLREIIVSAIIIDTQNTHAVLSKTDSTFINDYLMARDVWYELEYSLYGDCVSFLQSPDFDRLYAKFLTIHFSFRQRRNYINLFFQPFYNTAVALYYRQEYAKAVQTLDHLQDQQLPDTLFFIRLQLRLLRALCLYKLTKSPETAEELASLVKVISKVSPVFGRRWKAEFHFHEPIGDNA
ncbi:helix-turn-helix domain-containing protein [Lactobacillus paracasei subsp. tolerans]|uniref:helix-turn-helix domain-containing protein n=1 Tax=Lacticaseibacillus paracasei TaxID=1597 RepID=UPI00188B1C4E|nr:Rgg/GadR/MutR family transcriptional regulator [Lacticaseibacillus paracasei]MBF4174914.1 helix-turn-helix domain-containing protein [Lacticaseibacillus paracasei subsp. tolerans]